jgi:hypothetical protein
MRFPKLHLRDFFWLVLSAALFFGWWSELRKGVDGLKREEMWKGRADQLVGDMRAAGFGVELESRNSPTYLISWPAALLPRFWRGEDEDFQFRKGAFGSNIPAQ